MAESPLDGVEVDGPLRKLHYKIDAGEGVPQIVECLIERYARLADDPEFVLTEASKANRYELAARAKEWHEADSVYMNALRDKDRAKFDSIIEAEGWARALTCVFREQLAKCDMLWRGASWGELESYKDGTFGSREEKDGGRRGYMALSMWENQHCNVRPLVIKVPIKDIRHAIKPAVYTVLPRRLDASQERIDDAKEIRHADETECRIPDGTRVPRNTTIHVMREKSPLTYA